MGTDVHIVVVGDGAPQQAARARDRIADLEGRWSRFLASSEVSRCNANAGHPSVCSPDTVALVRRALHAWRITDGRFDPTVLGAVVRAGYDASFDTLDRVRTEVRTADARHTGAGAIVVDAATNLVILPEGVGFDPGGIGKGFAADIVSREAIDAGAVGVCVNVGGDIRVRGEAPGGGPWQVDVLDPHDPATVRAAVLVADGAVATSSRARRTWMVGEQVRHHLVDPATGEPIDNDVVAITVIARDGWSAEVFAKAAFVGGADAGLAFVEAQGAQAVVFDRHGGMRTTSGWPAFSGEPA